MYEVKCMHIFLAVKKKNNQTEETFKMYTTYQMPSTGGSITGRYTVTGNLLDLCQTSVSFFN